MTCFLWSDVTDHILEDDLLYSADEGNSSSDSISKQSRTKGSFLHFECSTTSHSTTYWTIAPTCPSPCSTPWRSSP
ncbi:hypothetical protein UPYG_G00338740 [Umbra pygmaea]|uniref:Uncharacterized protein n=1 Tax=Umbra pygmaea TaxID=75934 RepID=A0ABD0W0Q0_UMBPY